MRQKKTRPAIRKINLQNQIIGAGGMACVVTQTPKGTVMYCYDTVTFTYPA